MLNAIMLSVVILKVIMVNVIILSVVMWNVVAPYQQLISLFISNRACLVSY
jgi:hypothetical protein